MSELNLKWWQAKMLKEQIDAAREASVLGREGKLTMDNGCVIEWDNFNVKLEVPEDEDEDAGDGENHRLSQIRRNWQELSPDEKKLFREKLEAPMPVGD